MNDSKRHDRNALGAQPVIAVLEHRLHQAFAAPGLIEESVVDEALDPREIAMMVTAQMHPEIADEAAGAMVRHPDGMMVAVEDSLEPVGGVANLVPVKARPRIQPLMVGGDAGDEPC